MALESLYKNLFSLLEFRLIVSYFRPSDNSLLKLSEEVLTSEFNESENLKYLLVKNTPPPLIFGEEYPPPPHFW